MAHNISVPDIGDFDSVEIIEVLVKVGDNVEKNDPIVTLESDKSSVEVPSPLAGKISELNIKVGDKVSKGSLLAKLENGVTNIDKIELGEKNISASKKKISKKEKQKKVILKKNLSNIPRKMMLILLKQKNG